MLSLFYERTEDDVVMSIYSSQTTVNELGKTELSDNLRFCDLYSIKKHL